MIDAIQDVVTAEPEIESQPDSAEPDDALIETQLTQEIFELWSSHIRLSGDRRATAKELHQIRVALAAKLYKVKSLLSRPGRLGQWRGWLKQQNIPRSTADRLASRHGETLDGDSGNVPSGAISSSPEDSAERLAKSLWQRFRKFLATDESVINFISRIAELSGVRREWHDEGLVIFKPAPKSADGLPGSASATDPAPQSSDGDDTVSPDAAAESAMKTPPTEHIGDGGGYAEAVA